MANKSGDNQNLFSRLHLNGFDLSELTQRARRFASWYIDINEKLATDAIRAQSRATAWAKETPLARIFDAQNDLAQRMVERSANFARVLWRVEKAESKSEAAA